MDYMNTSPQMILALLRQLVKTVGVNQQDISVGDPLALFPNQYYDILHREFPDVHYVDNAGGNPNRPRTRVEYSSVPLYWSSRPAGTTQDYVPVHYAQAKYLINMANLKSHTSAGVTLCAKNHFGSLIRTPPAKGYYDMHGTLAQRSSGAARYRDLVDLMGHAQLGGKTLVYFIDGLYPGKHPIENAPKKSSGAPSADIGPPAFSSPRTRSPSIQWASISCGLNGMTIRTCLEPTTIFRRPRWRTTRPREHSMIPITP